jgi:hypothetical protein
MVSMRRAIESPGVAASTTKALMPSAAVLPSGRFCGPLVRANTQ